MVQFARSRRRAKSHSASGKILSVEEFLVDGIPVRLTRKRMKNTVLRVNSATGPVEVSAPARVSRQSVEEFVRSRRDWIEARRGAMETSVMARAEQATPEEVKEWRTVVSAVAPALIERWAQVMGVHPGKIDYRNMKSRWGSCQPATGRICLNVRLALFPPECLEYVVVHELCHLLEAGHGPRFHALMDQYLPDWRQRRDKLR